MNVTIHFLTAEDQKAFGREFSYSPRTWEKNEAIKRAVQKRFGKKAFLWRDNGLANIGIYGQVCEPIDQNSSNCITDRVMIEVD